MKQTILKLFIYVLISSIIYQGIFEDNKIIGKGNMESDGLSSDDVSMVLRSPTQLIMGTVSAHREMATNKGSTEEEMAKWFDDKVVGTPLESKGKDAVRYCKWEWNNGEHIKDKWPDMSRWISNCIRSSYAVGVQEQSLCTREPGLSTKNCFSLHIPGRKSSYVRWDGVSRHVGAETIRKYSKYDDSLRDFIHLQSLYYYGKMMTSPHGMSYAESKTWRNRVALFYNK